MNTRRGLGKGLGALIPTAEGELESIQVALDEIEPNTYQPRRTFDQAGLEELADSIKEHGLLQPIVVRPRLGGYQLVAGERRFRAAKIAGMDAIPAVIMELTDRQVAEIALVENLQREDLNPLEEAQAYDKLIKEFNLTQEALASRLGKSRSAIANTLRLLNLVPEVQQLIEQGKLTAGHARTLLTLPAEEQIAAARDIIEEKMTVRKAEKSRRKTTATAEQPLNPNLVAIQQQLMEHLGTKVTLEQNGGRGKIVIEFYSEEDANRIINNIISDGSRF